MPLNQEEWLEEIVKAYGNVHEPWKIGRFNENK